MRKTRQRLYASLLVLGAGILLYRAIAMLAEGTLGVFVPWVSALLVAELVIDGTAVTASLRWWITAKEEHVRTALRTVAAAIILHAFRVLVYVLGCSGPRQGFDLRPEQRMLQAERCRSGSVIFAAVMSVLGVLGVLIIWMYRRRNSK